MCGTTARVTLNTPHDVGVEHRLHVLGAENKPRRLSRMTPALLTSTSMRLAALDDPLHGRGAGLVVAHVHLLGGDPAARLRGRLPTDLAAAARVAAIEERDIRAFVARTARRSRGRCRGCRR